MASNSELLEKRVAWLRWGGSALPLLQRLAEMERWDEVAATARYALTRENCPDRDAVEALLERAGSPPSGWAEAVGEFAKNPTLEAWNELMRFTPPSVLYQRTRNTVALLRSFGVDPNIVFRCSAFNGMIPESIELAQSGEVDPAVIEARAIESDSGASGLWLGRAAEAAFARGDRTAMADYLRRAYEREDWLPPDMSVLEIREKADPETQTLLDQLGLPQQ